MPKLIIDEFTSQPVSRQRKYQLRKQARGCCRICGKAAKNGICKEHAEKARVHAQEIRTASPKSRKKRDPIWNSI